MDRQGQILVPPDYLHGDIKKYCIVRCGYKNLFLKITDKHHSVSLVMHSSDCPHLTHIKDAHKLRLHNICEYIYHVKVTHKISLKTYLLKFLNSFLCIFISCYFDFMKIPIKWAVKCYKCLFPSLSALLHLLRLTHFAKYILIH